jgi:hypothetical protein
MKKGKLSIRQKIYSRLCKILAGDSSEERATNLFPDNIRIKGIRLFLYNFFSNLRYKEGKRLVSKFKTHSFE